MRGCTILCGIVRDSAGMCGNVRGCAGLCGAVLDSEATWRQRGLALTSQLDQPRGVLAKTLWNNRVCWPGKSL
ncbi:hypothetical protein RRG08_016107 [Elysia crispata]|uniref:Uncharacterized protein n=1 Tax=Elysia crispata TaxID=231223 RepID=A0AAE1DJ98_9GAST|nr:hypothetical protein RRG08_016107 [Elysia crispata]